MEYKFNEGELIAEFQDYVDATYDQHYSKDKFQASEFIFDSGHGTGFTIGNVMKYAQRYGKKGTHADYRKDLMKILHYSLLALYVHDEYWKDVPKEKFPLFEKFVEKFVDNPNAYEPTNDPVEPMNDPVEMDKRFAAYDERNKIERERRGGK